MSAIVGTDFAEKLKAQEAFWRRLFPALDFGFDLDNMLVWPHKPGRDRLLVTPPGLWGNRLYGQCAQRFRCSRYQENLDEMVHLSGSPYVATARWFCDSEEAEEELKGRSAQDLQSMQIPGITVPERVHYELIYVEETGRHLDLKSSTLISGSRDKVGRVPRAYWQDGEFRIYYSQPEASNPFWRARRAA